MSPSSDFRHRSCRALATATLVLASLAPTAAADDVDVLIARPASPGTLALLIAHVRDPRVASHWRASLSHQSPQVRATAARLLFVNGIKAAVPDLLGVLAHDADRAVALEAARAALVMGTGAVDELVLAATSRLDAPELALAIAETRGTDALGRLGQFRQVKFDRVGVQRLVSALAARNAPHLDRIAEAAVNTPDPELWLAVLDVAHTESVSVDPSRLRSALQSASVVVRAYSWWHIAALAADGRVPEGVTAASLTTSDLTDVPPNLAFGRELATRVLSNTKPKQSYALTARKIGAEFEVPPFGSAALSGPLYRWLTKSEREDLRVVEVTIPDLRRPGTVSAVDYPGLRTVAELPDGYVADVLTQSGCVPKEPVEMAGAIVRYTQAKHLQELQWTANGLKSPCAEAARLILAASLLPAPVTAKPGNRVWVMLPMREQFLQCLGRATGQNVSQVERVGRQGIVPPRKIRDVRPEYPPMALANRRQGLVIIEAGISAAGCVDRAEVKQGAAMDFDLEALRAVTGWAFTPTLLDGRPVPVIMTVTVSFGLN